MNLPKRTYSKIARITAFSIAAFLLLILSFRSVDLSELKRQLLEADYRWLVLSFFASFVGFASRARRWDLMVHALGYKPCFWNTYHSVMTGYLINLIFPRAGELARCLTLSRKESIPVDNLLGTVIVERVVDLVTLVFIILFLLATRTGLLGVFLYEEVIAGIKDRVRQLPGLSLIAWLIPVVLMLICAVLIFYKRRSISKRRFFLKPARFIRGMWSGLISFSRMPSKGEFIFHTVLIWVAYTMILSVLFHTLNDLAHLGFIDGIFVLILGAIAMVAPVQGGIGAYHWMVSRGLLHIYGIPLEDGLTYATIAHESQMALVIFLGTISVSILFKRVRKCDRC